MFGPEMTVDLDHFQTPNRITATVNQTNHWWHRSCARAAKASSSFQCHFLPLAQPARRGDGLGPIPL